MPQTPAFEDLLTLIEDRSAALRSSVAGSPDLDVRVPSCPDWSLRELVERLTQVHRFWAAAVLRSGLRPSPARSRSAAGVLVARSTTLLRCAGRA
ncbi:maleylpyruvate isomerase N-terminal domain-containing protein [Streptomyces sp. NPDC058086]|uniref:maleylpyruvate isomerase N-terminal domain-containing protein n=1 Tax=Streptomyces sp. NPDC058086 TaxID=3346334 RepID=UPI0036E7A2CA